MTKKSQITLFVIAALVILFLISLAIYFINQNNSAYNIEDSKVSTFSEMRININKYIQSCIEENSRKYLEETGIREETRLQYIDYLEKSTKECAGALFSRLKEQAYEIDEGEISAHAEILDETINVNIDYPVTIVRNNQKTIVSTFFITIDRTYIQDIPNGKTKTQIRIPSKDGRAEIIIPPDVEIRDSSGNLIKKIGIKVEDRHFLGLNNGVVIGNLVYQGTPAGAQFSKPVEISIEIRDEDIPAGYPKSALYIANWDEKFQIWRGVPTTIIGTRAYANITHFSYYAVTKCDDTFNDIMPKVQNGIFYVKSTDNVFEQKYYVEGTNTNLFCPKLESNSNEYWSFSDSETKIIAKKINNNYEDNSKKFVNVVYGKKEDICEDASFVVPIEGDDCECTNINPETSLTYICLDGSKASGCNYGTIRFPSNGLTGDCICQDSKNLIKQKIGYRTSDCVGGRAEAGETEKIAALSFKGKGDSCIFHYRVQADCSTLSTNIITAIGEVIYGPPQDSCTLIPYTGLFADQAKLVNVEDHLELQVKGVEVTNDKNKDACAAARIRFYYIGFGGPTPINYNKKII